jgi:hypothetical protein
MQAQRQELFNQVHEQGWRIVDQEQQPDWWADELWQLESLWSPVGSLACVTFLVDPMSDASRLKGEHVWAVSGSRTKPASRREAEAEFTLSLGQGWKERLPEFLNHLAALRGHDKATNS